MTATIPFYDEDVFPGGLDVSDTLRDVLYEWQNNGLAGSHPANTGGFFPGPFSGTSYSYGDATLGYSFQVTGDLNYYFAGVSEPTVPGATNHTLYGEIDTITIGAGLDDVTGEVTTPLFTFTFDDPLEGDLLDGRTNVVHDVIWGLMNGSVTGATDSLGTISPGGLIAALEDNGLDVDLSVADLTGSSFLAESELLLAA